MHHAIGVALDIHRYVGHDVIVDLDSIQPIVLVGGKSRRFGRDKLREMMPVGVTLVSRPIETLRSVFGPRPRVAIVGECDPAISALADLVIPDPYPGAGPAGGILAALEFAMGPVFVLSGDLPAITPGTVRAILKAAEQAPDAHACLGKTDRTQPCIGLYRPAAIDAVRDAVTTGRGLHRAVAEQHRVLVPIDPGGAHNVNRPGDLPHQDSK